MQTQVPVSVSRVDGWMIGSQKEGWMDLMDYKETSREHIIHYVICHPVQPGNGMSWLSQYSD